MCWPSVGGFKTKLFHRSTMSVFRAAVLRVLMLLVLARRSHPMNSGGGNWLPQYSQGEKSHLTSGVHPDRQQRETFRTTLFGDPCQIVDFLYTQFVGFGCRDGSELVIRGRYWIAMTA